MASPCVASGSKVLDDFCDSHGRHSRASFVECSVPGQFTGELNLLLGLVTPSRLAGQFKIPQVRCFFVVGLTRYCLVTSILGYMCRSEATSSVRGPWSYIMYRVKPQGNQLTSPPSYNSVRRLQVHWRVPQESHCGRIPRHLRIGICRVESSQLFVLCCGVNGAHTLSYTVTGVTYMHAWRIWSYGTNWTHDK